MSYGVLGAQQTALRDPSRSFTDVRNATMPDSRSGTGGSFNTMFGSTSTAWGSGNIWGSGSLTNGFASRANTRDNSRSRDAIQVQPRGKTEEIEGKTGSGSLLDGTSELREWRSYGAKRNDPSSRSFSQAQTPEKAGSQQRSISNAGLQSTFAGASQTCSASYATRPPTISLNGTASAQPRPSFGSTVMNGASGRGAGGAEPPPTVYTKFDRPVDPSKQMDSVTNSWADTPILLSPGDERRPQWPTQYRQTSVSVSREPSLPPSRHSDHQPSFSRTDYSQLPQRTAPNDSREHSIASQRNGIYNGYGAQSADQLASQLSQLRVNGDNRPSTSFKLTMASNAFSAHGSACGTMPSYGRATSNGMPNGLDASDDIEEVDRSGLSYLGMDGYMSPPSTAGYPDYTNSTYGNGYLPTPASTLDYRRAQTFTPSSMSARAFDPPGGPRSPTDWQSYTNGAMQVNRRSPAVPDPQAYLDPRVQQILAAQLRNPYAQVYNPYVVSTGLQLPAAPQYLPLLQIPMNGTDLNSPARDGPPGDSVQSALMYEFKSNTKTKRYELKDIYDHIAEFSGDQHGSRFIQTKLETANSDEKDRVFREIEPNAIPLMTDVFGNYVIQKFFEHGDQTHKKILANKMRGQVLSLSLQMYGCRVVQKALDHVLVDQQALLISELENYVLKCVKDQNGNHVIQKAIERCPSHTIAFIIDAFRGQVQHLSIHPYGCRVIQRCLERCDMPSKTTIMAELMEGIQGMISDQFGNYVVQHVVTQDEGHGRKHVLQIVLRGLEGYSKHKFASNVVEKCLQQADDAWRRQVIYTLADCNHRRVEGEGVLVGMIKDNFGNYVIQKLLDTLCNEDFGCFVDLLHPAVSQAKRTGCGKQLMSVERKMHRTPPQWAGQTNGHAYNHGPYQMPLPTPPFASHYGSAATTPPPLTADTQSLQSSKMPSINGDAVEGADRNRKGSGPSNDARYQH
ncbi:hypothetical protein LTR36_000166 [Oleoguttula mirabilis]|uniref:Pumilio homology domain family member 3 n=1 Tax=Oleoguttula mirabilis TaxID=1507867 RepID=A0AAV9JY20_9PEZI|nr:hypothetical protein LTR36_000166 [Oleoguttula mirabilis]